MKKWVLVAQLCLTLCDRMDCSPPGFSVHGILQARILECVALPFSRRSSQPRDGTQVSCTAGRFFTVWAIYVWIALYFYTQQWYSDAAKAVASHFFPSWSLVLIVHPLCNRDQRTIGMNILVELLSQCEMTLDILTSFYSRNNTLIINDNFMFLIFMYDVICYIMSLARKLRSLSSLADIPLLLLLSRFSLVRLLATPWTAA